MADPFTLDDRCIFNKEWICITGKGCGQCYVFEADKMQVPVRVYYQFWYAVLQGMDEFKDILTVKRSFATSIKARKSRVPRPPKMSRSDAKKKSWAEGKYNGVRKKRLKTKFGEARNPNG